MRVERGDFGHLAVGVDLTVDLVRLAQPDVEDGAGLERAVARAADGDHAPRRGLDRLVVRVGDAGVLLAERLAHARAVRVHAHQVTGVELVEVIPLGHQHLAGVHDRGGDAVGQVARVELQVAAVGRDRAGLKSRAALVLVGELRRALLHHRVGGEQDPVAGQERRIDEVGVRIGRQLLDVTRLQVEQEQPVVLVRAQLAREDDAARVERQIEVDDVDLAVLAGPAAAQLGHLAVRCRRRQLEQPRPRHVRLVLEDVSQAVHARLPFDEDDGVDLVERSLPATAIASTRPCHRCERGACDHSNHWLHCRPPGSPSRSQCEGSARRKGCDSARWDMWPSGLMAAARGMLGGY